MKVIAVNGSPRTNRNTATLLQEALQGAEARGADTKLVHLYNLDYKGCASCLSCKRKGSRLDGLCAMKDDLKEVLQEILESDVLLLGSPIYFGNVTGEMRSFLERLLFPNLSYNEGERSTFAGRINSGFIYTMNVTDERAKEMNYEAVFQGNRNLLHILGGDSEILLSCDTYQFADYSKYEASRFDAEQKARVKEEQFPVDRKKAFELGARLAAI